jgi:hypothetical protein
VKWIVDRSWVRLDPAIRRRAERQALYLVFWSGLFWLALMALMIVLAQR